MQACVSDSEFRGEGNWTDTAAVIAAAEWVAKRGRIGFRVYRTGLTGGLKESGDVSRFAGAGEDKREGRGSGDRWKVLVQNSTENAPQRGF